jgi:hypothetical protein
VGFSPPFRASFRLTQERTSFLKKRSKKLLSIQLRYSDPIRRMGRSQIAKVFWFFFSKKNYFAFRLPYDRLAARVVALLAFFQKRSASFVAGA